MSRLNGTTKRVTTEWRAVCRRCNKTGPAAPSEKESLELAREEEWLVRHVHTCDDGTAVREVICPDCQPIIPNGGAP